MREWYRYETTEDRRKEELCKFLRRSGIQFQCDFGKRRLFRPGGAGFIAPIGDAHAIQFLAEKDQLRAVREWLSTH